MNETEATQVLPLEDVRPRFRLRYILACRGRFQQCRSSRSDIVSASGQTWPVRSCRSRHDRKKPHVRRPLPADPLHPCSSHASPTSADAAWRWARWQLYERAIYFAPKCNSKVTPDFAILPKSEFVSERTASIDEIAPNLYLHPIMVQEREVT
jgi:hypothetical protein